MSGEKDGHGELRALLVKLSDGALAEKDAQRLNALLRGDPEACEVYLNHQALEAQLERELGHASTAEAPVGVSMFRPESSAPVVSLWWRRGAVALAAAAALALALFLWRPATELPRVATVLFAEGCEWARPRTVVEGGRLCAGTLELRRGTAILRFDGGAEIVLRAGTNLELQSAARARLRRGDVTVRADGDAAGFKLLTPASELTDLGTEFAVKVDAQGGTELHVLEGMVAYGSAIANAGQAVRMESAHGAAKPVSLNATSFAEAVKMAAPRERPDLMTIYEGFHHDEGAYAPEQINKGKGWAGPWRLRGPGEQMSPGEQDTTRDMRIVHGRLTVPWPVPGGRLGMLELPAGRSFRVRPMASPVDMGRDGVTYFSLMTQEPDHSARREDDRPQEGIRLTFRAGADYWGESLSFGLGQQQRPQIQARLSGSFQSLAAVPDEQSLLWIGKITRRADGEDEISLRFYGQNEPLDYAEPAAWHVSTRDVRMNAALDLVVLSSTGTSTRIVDELRLGPTWRSVVPIQSELAKAR